MTAPEPTARSEGRIVKDAIEALRARAQYLQSWQHLYKWSVLAGLTGLFGGLAAVAFVWLLETLDGLGTAAIDALPAPWLLPVVPALGGVIVGLMRTRWAPDTLASPGATDRAIDAIHHDGGRIRPATPFITMVTSAVTLASGGSAGREGPTVLIGAGIGSITAKLVDRLGLPGRLSFTCTADDRRTLAICGIAAGLGAVFRAPIGSALFAVSVLYIYGMEYDQLMPALVSSLTSFLIFSLFFGFEPMFYAPTAWEFHVFDLAVVLTISVAASVVGILYIRVFYGTFAWFQRLTVPAWLKPGLGGLALGLLALLVPGVLGMGYGAIQDAIDYRIGASLLLVLVAGKILATSLTIGSGGAGGDMAPSLFIGAMLGGLIGSAAIRLFPAAPAHPELYVIAGMGAVYASVGKAPLATAILLCESTRNFTLILPLVIANTAASMASGNHTIYESQRASATRDQQDVLKRVPVERIYTRDAVTASADLSAIGLLRLIGSTGHHGFPVLDADGRFVGVVSWKDAKKVPYAEREHTRVADVMTTEPITVVPSDQSRLALNLIERHGIGRVVVVDPEDAGRVLGVVTQQDLIKAYAGFVPAD